MSFRAPLEAVRAFEPDLYSDHEVHSIPVPQAEAERLLRLARLSFGVPARGPVRRLGGLGINSANFLLGGRWVLKSVIRPDRAAKLPRQVALAKTLEAAGLPLPAFRRTAGGAPHYKHGGRVWALSGYRPGRYFSGSGDELEQAARGIGRLFRRLSTLPRGGRSLTSRVFRPALLADALRVAEETLRSLSRKSAFDRLALEALPELWEQHRRFSVHQKAWARLPRQVVHVDLHPHNLLFAGGRLSCILDPEAYLRSVRLSAAGLSAYKLSREAVISGRRAPEGLGRIFFDEFSRECPLTREERERFDQGAVAEILHRVCTILDLHYVRNEQTWDRDLIRHLRALREIPVLFGEARGRLDPEGERARKLESMRGTGEADEALLRGALSSRLPTADLSEVQRAIGYLRRAAGEARRTNYFPHPVRVAWWLASRYPGWTGRGVVVSILHNLPEVHPPSLSAIRAEFGEPVARVLRALAVDRSDKSPAAVAGYYRRLERAGREALAIKVLDKLDNLLVLGLNPDDGVRRAYLTEIERYILPACGRVLPALRPFMEELVGHARRRGFQPELRARLTAVNGRNS